MLPSDQAASDGYDQSVEGLQRVDAFGLRPCSGHCGRIPPQPWRGRVFVGLDGRRLDSPEADDWRLRGDWPSLEYCRLRR